MSAEVSVDDVFEALDGNDSDWGSEPDYDIDVLFDFENENIGDTEASANDDSSDSSDDDVPLSTFVENRRHITPPSVYKWSNSTFIPPENTNLCGKTDLPDYGIGTPYSFIKLFITDDMLNNVAVETNKYSVEKDGKSINCSPQELEQLLSMYFMMGIVQMPNVRSYWEFATRYDPVASVMSRARFEKLVTVLHFADNNQVTDEQKTDKLWKVRSWLRSLTDNFLTIPPEECQSVDEIMVPFKGRSNLKVYMPQKPHKWGFKIWGRSGASGFLYDFDVYQGAAVEKSELGVTGDIVTKLVSTLQTGLNHKVYADNYFTSLPLIENLKHQKIWYVGTIRLNRAKGCSLPDDKTMEKYQRGKFVYQVEEKTNAICLRWKDNKVVNIASSYVGVEPVVTTKRWDRKQKVYVEIDRPAIITQYNKFMGGIDLLNMCSTLYKFCIKSKRWYLYVWWHSLTMAMVNAWLLYRRYHEQQATETKQILCLRLFQAECAKSMATAGAGKPRSRGRPSIEELAVLSSQPTPRKKVCSRVPSDVRLDNANHFPLWDEKRQRCKLCPNDVFSFIKCIKCDVHLCLNKSRNCFLAYHK